MQNAIKRGFENVKPRLNRLSYLKNLHEGNQTKINHQFLNSLLFGMAGHDQKGRQEGAQYSAGKRQNKLEQMDVKGSVHQYTCPESAAHASRHDNKQYQWKFKEKFPPACIN